MILRLPVGIRFGSVDRAAKILEGGNLAEEGLGEWVRGIPEGDAMGLVDPGAGKAERWVAGEGWVEVGEGSWARARSWWWTSSRRLGGGSEG